MRFSAFMTAARHALGLGLVVAALAAPAVAKLPLPPGTPEIDPGSMLSAMTLLSGGLLIFADRRRKK